LASALLAGVLARFALDAVGAVVHAPVLVRTMTLAYVMGKPAEVYTGRDMYAAHAKFHIHGMHYDEVADVLKDVLMGGGVSKPDIDVIMKHVESLREMIVA